MDCPTNGRSSMGSQFCHIGWFVGVLIVMVVFLLQSYTDIFGTLERRYYDFTCTSTMRQLDEHFTTIAIGDQCIANIGCWPWPLDL